MVVADAVMHEYIDNLDAERVGEIQVTHPVEDILVNVEDKLILTKQKSDDER
jgi:hypothetical protein